MELARLSLSASESKTVFVTPISFMGRRPVIVTSFREPLITGCCPAAEITAAAAMAVNISL